MNSGSVVVGEVGVENATQMLLILDDDVDLPHLIGLVGLVTATQLERFKPNRRVAHPQVVFSGR